MQDKDQLLNVLSREGVLVNVSVRYWRAHKKLRAADLGLDPDDVTDRLISLGHKKLVPKDALKDFALIESRAHALVEGNTFPFLGGIGHYLPNTKLHEVTAKLDTLEQEFQGAQQRFAAQYADLRVQAGREWWDAARKLVSDPDRLVATIESSFPQPDSMDRYFSFQTHLFQVSIPAGQSQMELIAVADQASIAAARDRAAQQAASSIQQGTEQFVQDCVATMREQTAKLCEDMLASMSAGKTSGVHQKTLNRLVKFIDQFKDLNFANDTQMAEHLDRVRRELLSRTAEEYRDDKYAQGKLRQGLENLADNARELAKADTREIVERFGQLGKRKFSLAA